jgi:hypothetical protein
MKSSRSKEMTVALAFAFGCMSGGALATIAIIMMTR